MLGFSKKLGDGDYPYFDWGEANALFYSEFTLINNPRSKIKIFESFENSSKHSPIISSILISCGCIFKRLSKLVMNGSRVESIEEARKEYKKLLEEGWEKLIDSIVFLKK